MSYDKFRHNEILNESQHSVIRKADGALTRGDTNLLYLLKGLDDKAQRQVLLNYAEVISHNETKIPKTKLKIYCDGGCLRNPGPCGSGLVIYGKGMSPVMMYGDYTINGTNNIAELKALGKALLIVIENKTNAIIYTDSQYSIDCVTKWAYGWKRTNWERTNGVDIKNVELIKIVHEAYNTAKTFGIRIRHVKGHAGIEGNEIADRMAGVAVGERNVEYKEYNYTTIKEVLNMDN